MRTRNIILCSDGTGNSTIKGRGTNVFKLFEAIDITGQVSGAHSVEQVAVYDDGVGTNRLAPMRYLGGALGFGLARNVRQLYRALCRSYRPGSRIYLFGFSRGAYTVRTLAGIIVDCGIIDLKNPRPIRFLPFLKPGSDMWLAYVSWRAWRTHRRCYRAWIEKLLLFWLADGKEVARRFRARYARNGSDPEHVQKVHFVGVWDTVASIGLPFDWLTVLVNTVFYRFSFPDTQLSPHVLKGAQALAVDEERMAFTPILWNEDTADQEEAGSEARIEQVWFAGVHSNVGGGYPKQGLSLVALDWMMTLAEAHDLYFNRGMRQSIREQQNVHDRLYDSRAGLARYYRYRPRDIAASCAAKNAMPRLHATALDRITVGTTNYQPGSLPANTRVVETPGSGRTDLAALEDKLRNASEPPDNAVSIWFRRLSHFAMLAITLFVLDIAARSNGGWEAFTEQIVPMVTSLSFIDLGRAVLLPVWNEPMLRVSVLSLTALIWLLSTLARTRITLARSQFWRSVFSD